MKIVYCYKCKTPFEYETVLSRNDECKNCRSDLKVCLNCRFYDPFAKNQCKEPQAEPVDEKDKANFCGYFDPNRVPLGEAVRDLKSDAKDKLDALFKKLGK